MKKQTQKTTQKSSYCLPAGTRLNKRYVLKKVLGEGGFGITYLGWDEILAMPVAVKEYYPSSMAGRGTQGNDGYLVRALGGQKNEAYEKGKEAFLKEARVLSRFCQLEGIVLVRDFFQENGTAYIVMEYIDGISIKEYVQTKGAFSAEKTLELMKPVLQSLYAIHGKNLIHRDLSPDNILMTRQGRLKLIDFGAARHAGTGTQKTITVMFKRGFAALEQYQSKGDQGVWTDVYGISATMYYMMSGRVPEESVGRVLKDDLTELKVMQSIMISDRISDGIHKGMELEREKRYQNIAQLYQALYKEEIPEMLLPDMDDTANSDTISASSGETTSTPVTDAEKTLLETKVLSEELAIERNYVRRKERSRYTMWVASLLAMLVLGGVGVAYFQNRNPQASSNVKESEQAQKHDIEGRTLEYQSVPESETGSKQESTEEVPATQKPEEKRMPNLKGTKLTKAKKTLQTLGAAKIIVKKQYSSKIRDGKIIRQSISVGEPIKHKKVTLIVSKGKKRTVVAPTATPFVAQEKPSDSGQKEQVAGSLDSLLN